MITAISAYVCKSNKGSEHEIGWKGIQEASAKSEILYVFAPSDGNPGLLQQIEESGLANVRLFTMDIPNFMNRFLKSIPFIGFPIAAYLWELRLFFFMLGKFRFNKFDLAIRSSYGTYRYPSFLWLFSKKFIIDPISGGERFPIKLLGIYSFKGQLVEIFRLVMQKLPFIDPFVHITLFNSDTLYPVSVDSKTILPKYAQKKCVIKQNFLEINPDDFRIEEARSTVKIDENKLKLFYTGRVLEWKGIMFALKALEKIKDKLDYEFTIMGKGPGLSVYDKYIKEHQLNVTFVDPANVPRRDLSFYYCSHDIFVFPTMHGAGGFAPVEAKLHGMTLLTLDISGLDGRLENNDIVISTHNKNIESIIHDMAEKLFQYYRTHKFVRNDVFY